MRRMVFLLLAFLLSVTLTLGTMSCKKKEEAPPAKAPAVEEKIAPAEEAPAPEKAAPAEEKAAPAEEVPAPEEAPSGEAPTETAPAAESH